jgi:23S rRNA A2030 N6-methylase RlmJ
MGPAQYADTMLQSVFALCPKGHSIEQYRIYEAIEAGAIPVLEDRDGYLRMKLPPEYFKNSGLLFVDSWDDAPTAMQQLVTNTKGLDRRQQTVSQWYAVYMRSRMDEIELALESNKDPLAGSVCPQPAVQ